MNTTARQLLRTLTLGLFSACLSIGSGAQAPSNPPAIVADTAQGGGQSGGVFFMTTAVNGTALTETALSASLIASQGRGANMSVRVARRSVPSGPVTLTLQATEATAAPIQSILRSLFREGNREITGTVTVTLAAGQVYQAKGIIDAFRREIWLEDEHGDPVPGSKVAGLLDPELVKQMEGAGFTTTNLHYDGDWIGDSASLQLPFVPVGSRLKVVEWGKDRARILVDGRKMRIGMDGDGDRESIRQLVARVTSPHDPRPDIAGYPDQVKNAIRAARVSLGMSREQVLQSLGRPRQALTPDLSAREWHYDVPDQGPAYLVFDDSGLLAALDASRPARALILLDPQ
jgi:hypothetical protein